MKSERPHHAIYYQYRHIGASNLCICGKRLDHDSIWEPVLKLQKYIGTPSGSTIEFHKQCIVDFMASNDIVKQYLHEHLEVELIKVSPQESGAESLGNRKALTGPGIMFRYRGKFYGVVNESELYALFATTPKECRTNNVFILMSFIMMKQCDPALRPLALQHLGFKGKGALEDSKDFRLIKRINDELELELKFIEDLFDGTRDRLYLGLKVLSDQKIYPLWNDGSVDVDATFDLKNLNCAEFISIYLQSAFLHVLEKIKDRLEADTTVDTKHGSAAHKVLDQFRRSWVKDIVRKRSRTIIAGIVDTLSQTFDADLKTTRLGIEIWSEDFRLRVFDFFAYLFRALELVADPESGMSHKLLTSEKQFIRFLACAILKRHYEKVEQSA